MKKEKTQRKCLGYLLLCAFMFCAIYIFGPYFVKCSFVLSSTFNTVAFRMFDTEETGKITKAKLLQFAETFTKLVGPLVTYSGKSNLFMQFSR